VPRDFSHPISSRPHCDTQSWSGCFARSDRVTPLLLPSTANCPPQECPVVQHARVIVARRILTPQILVRNQVGQPISPRTRIEIFNAGPAPEQTADLLQQEGRSAAPWPVGDHFPAPVAQQQSSSLRTSRSQVQILPWGPFSRHQFSQPQSSTRKT
jgi:hypothetical protein